MNNEMFHDMGPGTPPTMPGPIPSPSFGPRLNMPGGLGGMPGGPGGMPGGPGGMPGGPGGMPGGPGGMPGGPGGMPGGPGGMPGGPGGMPGGPGGMPGGPGGMPGGPGGMPFNVMTTRPGMPGHIPGPGPNMMHNMPGPMSGGPNTKVYPPNQPMIFNNSNPNAPPIYPCGICHKEVHDNDQAILCESGCNFWFHRACTGLTEPAYTMLTQEVFAEWVCDRCFGSKNMAMVKLKS